VYRRSSWVRQRSCLAQWARSWATRRPATRLFGGNGRWLGRGRWLGGGGWFLRGNLGRFFGGRDFSWLFSSRRLFGRLRSGRYLGRLWSRRDFGRFGCRGLSRVLEYAFANHGVPGAGRGVGVTVDREWTRAADLGQRAGIDLARHFGLERELGAIDRHRFRDRDRRAGIRNQREPGEPVRIREEQFREGLLRTRVCVHRLTIAVIGYVLEVIGGQECLDPGEDVERSAHIELTIARGLGWTGDLLGPDLLGQIAAQLVFVAWRNREVDGVERRGLGGGECLDLGFARHGFEILAGGRHHPVEQEPCAVDRDLAREILRLTTIAKLEVRLQNPTAALPVAGLDRGRRTGVLGNHRRGGGRQHTDRDREEHQERLEWACTHGPVLSRQSAAASRSRGRGERDKGHRVMNGQLSSRTICCDSINHP
jgi:hypothetical protein